MKPTAFEPLRDLESAFAKFRADGGEPRTTDDPELFWGKVHCSKQLNYARSLNDFEPLLIPGKFPPQSQFVILCALQVYGGAAFDYWRIVRDHYCRGKPRGVHAAEDESLDVWYAVDAWLQSWLYSPSWCRRPQENTPAAWLYCIGSTTPTPHLRMSHAFLRDRGARLPSSYATARRNLLDVKGIFQRNAIIENGSRVPKIEPFIYRFPLVAWDIWQRSVYLLTNDVKPPSHFPIFGWRHHRVRDYFENRRLLLTPELEHGGLGQPWSLHGLLWPQQLETLQKIVAKSEVRTNGGPPITSGRMSRRRSAHQ
jgi:hypothetical protein